MRHLMTLFFAGLTAASLCTSLLASDVEIEETLPPELFPDRDAVVTPVPLPVPEPSTLYTVRQAAAFSDDTIAVLIQLKISEEVRGETHLLSRPTIRTLDGQKAIVQVSSGDRILGIEIEPHLGTPEEQADRVAETRREMKLQRVLQRRISVDYSDVPLRDVVAELARRCEVNLVVDPAGLEEEGQTLDKKITYSGSGMRLSRILDEILSPLLLDYLIVDDVIKITSQSRARGEPVTMTYPVSDLLRPAPNGKTRDAREALDNLARKVTQQIAPATWNHKGGWGSVHAFHATQSLVIRQVPDVQDEIALLLRDLRKKQAPKGDPPPSPADLP